MKIFCRLLITLIILTFITFYSDGQEATISTGSNITGSGGKISYSVGQVAFITHSGVNGSVAAGVQQAYEISVLTEAENTKDIKLSYSVYPNPTTNILFLQVDTYKFEGLSFRLYDISGTLLDTQIIESGKTTIAMSEYVSAIYFLHVSENQETVKTFKIVKQ